MKAKLLTRAAAVFVLLHLMGHIVGTSTWKQGPNRAVQTVIDGMQSQRFNFMGRMVSLGDFFTGYGHSMTGVLLMLIVSLWLLSNDTVSRISVQLRALIGITLLFLAIMEWIFFFPLAAALSLLAGICALVSLKE